MPSELPLKSESLLVPKERSFSGARIKVKVSSAFGAPRPDLSQFLDTSRASQSGMDFLVGPEHREADFWFVLEEPDPEDLECRVPSERVIYLNAETSWPPGYCSEQAPMRRYLQQFGRVYTCHDTDSPESINTQPFLPWMINANHGPGIWSKHPRDFNRLANLDRLDKTKVLSVVCSSQSWTPTHRMRFRFVSQLKEYFKDALDWYGNGVRPVDEKWDALAPYRYTIALENGNATNLVTEKILDPFLTWTVPIYWGADNISEIFDADGLIKINIRDVKGSIETIQRVLEESPYESFIPALELNRKAVLGRLNLFNRIMDIVENWDEPAGTPTHVRISRSEALLSRRDRAYQKMLNRLVRVNRLVKKAM